MKPPATQRTLVPLASGRVEIGDPVASHIERGDHQVRQSVVLASIWIDIGQAIGRYRSSKTKFRRDTCTGFEHIPHVKAPGRVRSGIETDELQIGKATTQGNREKRRPDSPGGETVRRRRGGHHTLAARF